MVVRTQISIEADELRRAKQRAAELDVSLAEYIRRLVARDLGEEHPAVPASAIFGLFNSGGSDVAKNKHEMIAEAVDAAHPRR